MLNPRLIYFMKSYCLSVQHLYYGTWGIYPHSSPYLAVFPAHWGAKTSPTTMFEVGICNASCYIDHLCSMFHDFAGREKSGSIGYSMIFDSVRRYALLMTCFHILLNTVVLYGNYIYMFQIFLFKFVEVEQPVTITGDTMVYMNRPPGMLSPPPSHCSRVRSKLCNEISKSVRKICSKTTLFPGKWYAML